MNGRRCARCKRFGHVADSGECCVSTVPADRHHCATRTTHCGDPGCDQCSDRFMPPWSAHVAPAAEVRP